MSVQDNSRRNFITKTAMALFPALICENNVLH